MSLGMSRSREGLRAELSCVVQTKPWLSFAHQAGTWGFGRKGASGQVDGLLHVIELGVGAC